MKKTCGKTPVAPWGANLLVTAGNAKYGKGMLFLNSFMGGASVFTKVYAMISRGRLI